MILFFMQGISVDSDGCERLCICFPNSSQRRYRDDKFNYKAGHGSTSIYFLGKEPTYIRATWHLVLSCWQLWRFLYVAMSDTIRHQKELLIFSWTTVSTSTVSNRFTNHNTASSETVLFMYIGFCVAFNFITYLNSHSVIDSI